jgi:hypothetical protein
MASVNTNRQRVARLKISLIMKENAIYIYEHSLTSKLLIAEAVGVITER